MRVEKGRTVVKSTVITAGLVLAFACSALAQQSGETQSAPALGAQVDSAQKAPPPVDVPSSAGDNEGVREGGYMIKQSLEFGGRIASVDGNPGTYDSYVNLRSGPRLLGYTLDMHSPEHTGLLFDDLTLQSFGYGGDPNDVSRLMMQKGKWYRLNVSSKRDQNVFDYNLFANPLNPVTNLPGTTVANPQLTNSPHEFLMTRRMNDTSLHLLPTSKVQFRLGWSRVTNEGTTFSSFHQGNEALLQQPTSYINDNYSGGVTVKFAPRTSISYDQFYTFYKGDQSAFLAPSISSSAFGVPTFTLPNGAPVNFGLSFNPAGGFPCATPLLPSGAANPACNAFFGYSRSGRVRNTFPTEQLSLQSNLWKRLDVTARGTYSGASSEMPDYNSTFSGLETRTRAAVQSIVAPDGGGAQSKRLSLSTDLGMTFKVTEKFSIVDQLRYSNFRIPGSWLYTTSTLFAANLTTTPNTFSTAACPNAKAAGCPQHSAASGPDNITDSFTNLLKQAQTTNTFQLEYDFTRRFNAHVGYRFDRRNITSSDSDTQVQVFLPSLPNRGACAGQPLVNGICTISVLDGDDTTVQITDIADWLGSPCVPPTNGASTATPRSTLRTISSRASARGTCRSTSCAATTVRRAGWISPDPCTSARTAILRWTSETCSITAASPSAAPSCRRVQRSASISPTTTTTCSRRPTSASSQPRALSAA